MKAFLFDLDGVVADTLSLWDQHKPTIFKAIFGQSLSTQLNAMNWRGKHILEIYKAAVILGHPGTESDYLTSISKLAIPIYAQCTITARLEEFLQYLRINNYQIGLVTSSQSHWANRLLKRIRNHQLFDLILSVHDQPALRPKPAPDGYLYAMNQLGVTPSETWILEDSATGIAAALSSGAHTIWFNAYHTDLTSPPPGVEFTASTLPKISAHLTLLA